MVDFGIIVMLTIIEISVNILPILRVYHNEDSYTISTH
jgi:hypothetical protein